MLLAGGAAGDFSTMTFDERVAVGETVVDGRPAASRSRWAARRRAPWSCSAWSVPRRALGADYVQVSPPFYHAHTEGDFLEHVLAGADAADVGLIIYNTFWTSLGLSSALVERLADVPNVVSLKWSTPDTAMMAFEDMVTRFASRFAIIDNQMRYVISHMLGARSIEIHQGNYWPQFAVGLWQMLERGDYVEAQREMVRVCMPFMELWGEIEGFTGGDGYLDKLCMELVGLPSSRYRPPTRDVATAVPREGAPDAARGRRPERRRSTRGRPASPDPTGRGARCHHGRDIHRRASARGVFGCPRTWTCTTSRASRRTTSPVRTRRT